MESLIISLSVKDLIQRTSLQGDLVSSYSFTRKDAARQGVLAHQKIQKSRPENYIAEKNIRSTFSFESLTITVQGRIDGLFYSDDSSSNVLFVVEEIKTTEKDLSTFIEQNSYLHKLQAELYAWLLLKEEYAELLTSNSDKKVGILLTYYHIQAEKEFPQSYELTLNELNTLCENILNIYHTQILEELAWQKKRNSSLLSLEFPFDFRDGQYKMASEAYRAFRDHKSLIIQAPTGIGKSIAAIFPALKAMGQELSKKIFFFTARNTGKLAAENTVRLLLEHKAELKAVTISSKEKICLHPDSRCLPEECPLAKGYYDKLRLFFKENKIALLYSQETIINLAKQYQLCPFELSLDISLRCDIVILDYNYILSPPVMLKRYFGDYQFKPYFNEKKYQRTEKQIQRNIERGYIFLFDEAHNIIDRAADIYSAKIDKRSILNYRRSIKEDFPKIKKSLDKINRLFLDFNKEVESLSQHEIFTTLPENIFLIRKDSIVYKQPQKDFIKAVKLSITRCEEVLADQSISETAKEDLLDLYFSLYDFIRIYEMYGDNYVVLLHLSESKKAVSLELFCTDSAPFLVDLFQEAASSLFFSATLVPMTYFSRFFLSKDDSINLQIPSPFPSENRLTVSIPFISTIYKERPDSIKPIARVIHETINSRKGNYIVFFPSYSYLSEVFETYTEQFGDSAMDILKQEGNMDDKARSATLDKLKSDDSEAVLFAVLGGVFSESIDLVGDGLIGTVVVGVGLPSISTKKEISKTYYDQSFQNGFALCYQFPGINKVLQAAGRVIRSSTDKGVVIYIGSRYTRHSYKALLPKEYPLTVVKSVEELKLSLNRFWNKV